MKKEPKIFIAHIIESIGEIEKHTRNISLAGFIKSTLVQDAAIRRLEIIGEAVRRIPPEVKTAVPDIPWKQIAGLRNVLIHEYFGVDLRLVWKVIAKDIPNLKKSVIKLQKKLP